MQVRIEKSSKKTPNPAPEAAAMTAPAGMPGGAAFGLAFGASGALNAGGNSLLVIGWLALLLSVIPPPWAGLLLRAVPIGRRPQHFVEPLEPPG